MSRRLCLTLAIAIFAWLSPVAAQDGTPRFDAASIKPQDGDPGFVRSSPGRFADVNATLRSLIAWAWNVRDFQIEGGPEWARSRRFEVLAHSPQAVTEATMRLMVRQLLADRFQLKIRVEPREMSRYVLRTRRSDGRFGPGLQPSAVDCAAALSERFGAPPPVDSNAPPCPWRVGISPPVARMMVDGAPMRDFAGLLERLLNRKVVDRTGLDGAYDIRLEFSADQLPVPALPGSASGAPAPDGLSVFTALEEQLGLKLESERGPVDVIVIESAQPPTPN